MYSISGVLNFAIEKKKHFPEIYNFEISVKIRKESLIEYQFFYC